MSIQDWVDKTQRSLEKLLKSNKPLQIASKTAHQQASRRIFFEGRKVNGSRTGIYDFSNEMYVDVNKGYWSFAKLRPAKGKYGNRKFKNGKDHKTRYFANYDSLRSALGRQTAFVDFAITGDFRSDYMNAKGIGGAVPIKVNTHEYKVELSRGKTGGISHAELKTYFEAKYHGKIFTLSKEEKEKFYEVAAFEFKKLFA